MARHRWRHCRDDEAGNASLEFLVGAMILLVPVVYLVLALGVVQNTQLAIETLAQSIARAVSTAPDAEVAQDRISAALTASAENYGLDADAVTVELGCIPADGVCPRAGTTLRVTVRAASSLPLMPQVLGLNSALSVPVETTVWHPLTISWGIS